MQLLGEKIVLKPATENELESFTRWMNDPEVTLNLGVVHGKNPTFEEEVEWFKGIQADPNEVLFSIFTSEEGKLVGNCGVHLKHKREDKYNGRNFLGLVIGEKDEWNKGYGTEAILLLLQYLKDNDLGDAYLTVNCENLSAIRVYKRCGFEIVEKREREGGGEEYVMKA